MQHITSRIWPIGHVLAFFMIFWSRETWLYGSQFQRFLITCVKVMSRKLLKFTFQVDEITNIVTDVTGDPTLPRSNERPCPECRHREAVFFQVSSEISFGSFRISFVSSFLCCPGLKFYWLSTHFCDFSRTPRKPKQRWSSTTSAPIQTATIGGPSKPKPKSSPKPPTPPSKPALNKYLHRLLKLRCCSKMCGHQLASVWEVLKWDSLSCI